MRIRLVFPEKDLDRIRAMGLRQGAEEKLRLVGGVIKRGCSDKILDADVFAALRANFNAWILVETEAAQRRVLSALQMDEETARQHIRIVRRPDHQPGRA